MECTKEEQRKFKLMYSHGKPELPINIVVNNMHESRLSWAMEQVHNTITKRKVKNNEWYRTRNQKSN